MNKLFPRSIKRQLFVMVFIMAFFAAGIIVYSEVSSRNEKIAEALKDSAMLADSLFNEHEKRTQAVGGGSPCKRGKAAAVCSRFQPRHIRS